MSNEEILAELNKGMTALHNGIKNVNQALSSANIAVGQVEAYNKGLEDAWECVKKLTVNDYLKDGYDSDELLKIFGTDNIFCILKNYTPQEALAKLEAYEKEQAEIKVGDVVTIFPRSGGQYDAIVVFVKKEKYIDAIYSDGVTTNNVPPELYKKTGKHIDIQSVLQQIGGGSNE